MARDLWAAHHSWKHSPRDFAPPSYCEVSDSYSELPAIAGSLRNGGDLWSKPLQMLQARWGSHTKGEASFGSTPMETVMRAPPPEPSWGYIPHKLIQNGRRIAKHF